MKSRLPPGPSSGRFGLQQSRELRHDFIGFGTRLHQQYGDIVHYQLGPHSCFQLLHPEHIQEVLIRQAKKLRKPARFKNVFGRLQGDGLVTGDGDHWAAQRQLIQPVFQSAQFDRYGDTIALLAEQMCAAWPSHGTIDFGVAMRQLALRVIAQTLFSTTLDDHTNQLGEAVDTIQEWGFAEMNRVVVAPRWWPLWGRPKVRRAFATVNKQIEQIIDDRRSTPTRTGDLLDLLLHTPEGQRLSTQQVHHEATSLFVAGHETITIALTWAGWLLARYPESQQTIADEVTRTLGQCMPRYADIARLESVDSFFRETVRLYPPIYFFAREVAELITVGGYEFPSQSQIFLSPYHTHHDERWFPDPHRFDPTRFTATNERGRPLCAWFPFGAGPRGCIGRSFAQTQAILTLARLVQRYRFEPIQGQTTLKPEAHMHLRPQGGLRLQITQRR